MSEVGPFVRKWERAVRWCAVGIVLRFPDVASDEDDLMQVGRIACWRSLPRIERTTEVGFQLREVRQISRNAMHRYLESWRGWRRSGVADPKRGPAHQCGGEGSESAVWGVLSVESHESWVLTREAAATAVQALHVLTPAQRSALLSDDDVDRDEQKRRAQLRLSARKKLNQHLAKEGDR